MFYSAPPLRNLPSTERLLVTPRRAAALRCGDDG
jgi:hypothetical protein